MIKPVKAQIASSIMPIVDGRVLLSNVSATTPRDERMAERLSSQPNCSKREGATLIEATFPIVISPVCDGITALPPPCSPQSFA